MAADSTVHSSECDTECFSDDSEVEVFEINHRCSICKVVNADSLSLAQACINDTDTECVIIANNIVWLRCMSCKRFFHLKCCPIKYNLADLLDIIEGQYMCVNCN